MSKEKETKGKGWFEKKDPLRTNKKGEPVCPIHQEVAQRKEFEKQGFTGATAIVPSAKTGDGDIVSLRFNIKEKDIPEFTEANEEYMEKNDIVIATEAEGDRVTIKIPVENVEDFVDFLYKKNGFELENEEEKQVEEIIEKGAAKRAEEDSDGNSSK